MNLIKTARMAVSNNVIIFLKALSESFECIYVLKGCNENEFAIM